MLRIAIGLVLVSWLAACGSPAQLKAMGDVGSKCSAAKNDPRIAAVDGKVGGSPTSAMLMNKSIPTGPERAALLEMDSVYTECWSAREQFLRQMGLHDLVTVHSRYLGAERMARAKLAGGAMTYGEYNAYRQEMSNRWQEAVNQSRMAYERREAAKQQQIAQQNQAWFENQMRMMEMFNRPSTANRVVNTDCRVNGSNISCSSF